LAPNNWEMGNIEHGDRIHYHCANLTAAEANTLTRMAAELLCLGPTVLVPFVCQAGEP